MRWRTIKIQGDNQNPLEFNHIKTEGRKLVFIKNNNGDREKIKEDVFAFQARIFLEKFEEFAQVKDKSDQEKLAYLYYDSEGIPTIGYGFNLAEPSICNLIEKQLQYRKNHNLDWNDYSRLIAHFKLKKLNANGDEYILELADVFNENETNQKHWINIVKNFDKSYQEKDKMGRNNPPPQQIVLNKKQLNANLSYLTSVLQTYLPFAITKENAKGFLASLINERRFRLERRYQTTFKLDNKERFSSYEQLALLSLFYNSEKLVGQNSDIDKAIKENNRFKVWFEIRYRSNGGKSKGIAKRRFAESNIFGLFDGIERGGFDNTAEWSKKHTPTLQEVIEFLKFLYSPFRKEYKAKIEENGQTKIIKKTTNNYIDYIKAYETEMVFEDITLNEYHHPEFKKHYTPFSQLLKSYTEVIFSDFKKINPCFSASPSISVFSQPLFHSISSTPNIIATESIKIALNPINKRLNQIRSLSSLPSEAFFISAGLYAPKNSINNQGLVTHILLDTSSHFDCNSFTHPQNIIFYIILHDHLGLNAKILKLEGCPKALVEVKDFQIGMMGKIFNGLIQINEKEDVIYCFEKEANGKNSPNLTIYDKFGSNPLVTIFNLRSKGNNNA